MDKKYVIINNVDKELFWSNEFGWVTFKDATTFTEEERSKYILPIEGMWALNHKRTLAQAKDNELNVGYIQSNELTEECWTIQLRGLEACKDCKISKREGCGGIEIIRTGKNSKGFKVPVTIKRVGGKHVKD